MENFAENSNLGKRMGQRGSLVRAQAYGAEGPGFNHRRDRLLWINSESFEIRATQFRMWLVVGLPIDKNS